MQGFRYFERDVTLQLDESACTGCGACVDVCPHGVFEIVDGRARINDRGACMECSACATNCAFGAISVRQGVGCASAVISSWFRRDGSDNDDVPANSGGCC